VAVFTRVLRDELQTWLTDYSVGTLTDFRGIESGIENTNYFVTTSEGEFVLTLFEVLKSQELPFYLNFMAHLANHGIPCPRPIANLQNQYLGEINNKPASLVSRLEGTSVLKPSAMHCAKVGKLLANMHLAAKSFPLSMDNPRGAIWRKQAAAKVWEYLSGEESELLQSELNYQDSIDVSSLPRSVVHADLFRDNILFRGSDIGGAVDFYFAGNDAWLFDLAVTVNDWCMASPGELDLERLSAMLEAYCALCPVTGAEKDLWPAMLRSAALRFWLSRLYDFYLPRPGEIVKPHDPGHFQKILLGHKLAQPHWLK
jgi:homoserine kinase type II